MNHDSGFSVPGDSASLSGLAVVSALLAASSTGLCLVLSAVAALGFPAVVAGLLPLPVLGVGAVVCGGLALRAIGRAKGRVAGRALAVFGLLLGLVMTVLLTAMSVAAFSQYWSLRSTLAPAVTRAMSAASGGATAEAAAYLAPATALSAGDERLRALVGVFEEECGPFVRAGFDMGVFTENYRLMRGAAPAAPPPGGDPLKPLRLVGGRGSAMAYIQLDGGALRDGRVLIFDMCVLLPGGRAATLLPAGAGAQTARMLGFEVVEPDDRG